MTLCEHDHDAERCPHCAQKTHRTAHELWRKPMPPGRIDLEEEAGPYDGIQTKNQ